MDSRLLFRKPTQQIAYYYTYYYCALGVWVCLYMCVCLYPEQMIMFNMEMDLNNNNLKLHSSFLSFPHNKSFLCFFPHNKNECCRCSTLALDPGTPCWASTMAGRSLFGVCSHENYERKKNYLHKHSPSIATMVTFFLQISAYKYGESSRTKKATYAPKSFLSKSKTKVQKALNISLSKKRRHFTVEKFLGAHNFQCMMHQRDRLYVVMCSLQKKVLSSCECNHKL